MTGEYSQTVCWPEEYHDHPDRWINHGWRVVEEACTHKSLGGNSDTNMRYAGYCEECDVGESDCEPMMNLHFVEGVWTCRRTSGLRM
jgi:hypothetical protein